MEKRFGAQPFGSHENELFKDDLDQEFDQIFGRDPLTGSRIGRSERYADIEAHAPEFVRIAFEKDPELSYEYSTAIKTFVVDRYFLYEDPNGILYWTRNKDSKSVFEIDAIKPNSEQESPDMRRFREKVEAILKTSRTSNEAEGQAA